MIDPTTIKYEDTMGREPMEDSPNDDAEIFLRGNCHMFALALHEKYGYPIYKWDRGGCHYFCIFNGKYIDVRGVMDTITTSIEYRTILPDEIEAAEEYRPKDDIEQEAYDFALKIIDQSEDRYVLG